MDPLTTEPLGDSEDELADRFNCSVDFAGGTSSEHNSPKSASTRECSPSASATEMADETLYTREEHFLQDNGDIAVHTRSKPIKCPSRSSTSRPAIRTSERHKKSVQVQCEGKKFKSANKPVKKEKQPVSNLYFFENDT